MHLEQVRPSRRESLGIGSGIRIVIRHHHDVGCTLNSVLGIEVQPNVIKDPVVIRFPVADKN
jgi:hypothetical protein